LLGEHARGEGGAMLLEQPERLGRVAIQMDGGPFEETALGPRRDSARSRRGTFRGTCIRSIANRRRRGCARGGGRRGGSDLLHRSWPGRGLSPYPHRGARGGLQRPSDWGALGRGGGADQQGCRRPLGRGRQVWGDGNESSLCSCRRAAGGAPSETEHGDHRCERQGRHEPPGAPGGGPAPARRKRQAPGNAGELGLGRPIVPRRPDELREGRGRRRGQRFVRGPGIGRVSLHVRLLCGRCSAASTRARAAMQRE
jgi:hypothetical protein